MPRWISVFYFFTLSRVRIPFLARNPRAQLTVIIRLIRLLSLILLGGGLLIFTSHAPPVIPGLQDSNHINPIFGRDAEIVTSKLLLGLLLHNCGNFLLDFPSDNVLLVGYFPVIPGGFMVLLILHDRKRD